MMCQDGNYVETSIPAMSILYIEFIGKLFGPVDGPRSHRNHLVLFRIDGEGICKVVTD